MYFKHLCVFIPAYTEDRGTEFVYTERQISQFNPANKSDLIQAEEGSILHLCHTVYFHSLLRAHCVAQ